MDNMDERDDTLSEERRLFKRFCLSKRKGFKELWRLPWWSKPSAKALSLSQGGTQLVQLLAKSEPEESKQEPSGIPPGPETPLFPLKKLGSAEPSLLGADLLSCLQTHGWLAIWRLMKAADEALKLEKRTKLKRTEIRSKLKLAERKVYFIMCWLNEQPVQAWPSLPAIVSTERASAIEYQRKPMKMGDKPKSRSKVLIEEVK
ncbi:hypothetical protein RJ641_001441 [Dillenia turbinata]|uniref:Uncharacterized protein n=1 Tax=Dillenia turbinata TaxID=194707 RepID=A0AAN8WK17_9MAGN